ncbi:MAG: hypothetical protein IPK64_05960 [bacterium]|nr:hypothetical protein [bacterium]
MTGPAAARGSFPSRARETGSLARRAAAGGIAALALLVAAPALSQLPWFDPLPAWSPADTLANRAFALEATHLADGRTGWNAHRVVLEARFPAGRRGYFYGRLPWVRLDTGRLPVLERWPDLAGDEAVPGWPGEAVLSGFGQLELGAGGPARLPGLGPVTLAMGVGVPLGHSRFYPLSSSGLPVRLEATRRFRLVGNWNVLASAGLVRHGGPGDDVLDATAFPDGTVVRLALERSQGPHTARVTWSPVTRGGREEQWLSAEFAGPWAESARLAVVLSREVSGSDDRLAAWALGLAWRLMPRVSESAPTVPAASQAP